MAVQNYFEIFLTNDKLEPSDWLDFYHSLVTNLGPFSRFDIIFSCQNNTVRFFVKSDKDIGAISNSVSNIILYPVSYSDVFQTNTDIAGTSFKVYDGPTLLDIREKIQINNSATLEKVIFKVFAISNNLALIKSDYIFGLNDVYHKTYNFCTNFPTELLSIDFSKNTRYFKKSQPKYLDIAKSLHMMVREDRDAIFEVNTFPYLSQKYFLNLTNYDFDKHSLIIGASGSGKSKLIGLIVDRLNSVSLSMNYRIIVIDPHASIAEDFSHISRKKIVTFDENDGADLFPDASSDISSATELTATLFKSVLGSQYNPRLDKLLRFSLFVLMTAQVMTLENLRRFLTDIDYRTKIVDHVSEYIPDNIVKFFSTGFNEVRTRNYDETILPIISMVDEMQLQPSLVGDNKESLAKLIRENFLTVFSINKISMGERTTKTVAGLLIQQIFLLAQSRVFGQKLILIIDEVSIVQSPTLTQILAEARKFNLTVILTQQYLGQVNDDLRQAIFANVINYYVFKVSEDDAKLLVGNLNIDLPKQVVKDKNEVDLKIKIMTGLQNRECLVRASANGQIAPCIKAKTLDAPESYKLNHLSDKFVTNRLPAKFVETDDNPKQIVPSENVAINEANTIRPQISSSIYNLITMNAPKKETK